MRNTPAALLLALLAFGAHAHAQTQTQTQTQTGPVATPFELHSGHVYINAVINDQGPFHLLFDTGAVNVLTPGAAQRLGLVVNNNVSAQGTGGAQAGGSAKVKAVRIAGLSLTDQTFYVLDLPAGASDDGAVDGLIGWEWLNRFPTRIDYAAQTLTFFPDGRPIVNSATSPTPIRFAGKRPLVAGKIDGIEGKFTLDTGSPGSVTLATPFVESHDLVGKYHPKTKVMSAVGVGGPVYAWITRAETLELGAASISQPVTFLSQQTSGTSAAKDVAGNVGFGVLHRFTLTFDYPHAAIYFEPNRFAAEPDLADRSGLRILRSGSGFKVQYVGENTPAAQAGLKEGDVILAVDGAPCVGMSSDHLKALFKGPVGTKLKLTLVGGRADVTLTLAEL